MRASPILLRFVLIAVGGSALPACIHADYLYRHEVAGVVVDPTGAPLSGAEVFRTDRLDGSEVYGLPELYQRTSGDDGTFLFEYSGLGGDPETEQTWFLGMRRAGYLPRTETLVVPWVDGTGDQPPQGYVLRDVVVTLEPEPERHWVVWADDLRLLEISNRPGAIIDTTAPPPPPSPDGPPPPHPFLGAACGGDALLCSRAGVILRASTSLDEFLAALAAEGWRVEETTP